MFLFFSFFIMQIVFSRCLLYRRHQMTLLIPSHLRACVLFLSGSTASPTSPWGPALACGQPSSVSCWWPRTPARSSATSHASPRRLSLRWSASSSSTRLWRSCSTWGCTIPSINTTTFRNSHSTGKWNPTVIVMPVCPVAFLHFGCFVT